MALLLAAGFAAGAAGVRAQETAATEAVSRQVTMHVDGTQPTEAVSRQVTMHFVGLPLTFATSRQVTFYLTFRWADAVSALQIAAGLRTASGPEAAVYNMAGSAPGVDVGDAAQIARYAAGTIPAP